MIDDESAARSELDGWDSRWQPDRVACTRAIRRQCRVWRTSCNRTALKNRSAADRCINLYLLCAHPTLSLIVSGSSLKHRQQCKWNTRVRLNRFTHALSAAMGILVGCQNISNISSSRHCPCQLSNAKYKSGQSRQPYKEPPPPNQKKNYSTVLYYKFLSFQRDTEILRLKIQ